MMMVLKNIDAIRLIRIIPNPSSKLLGFWQAMRVGLILIMLSTTMAAHQLLAAYPAPDRRLLGGWAEFMEQTLQESPQLWGGRKAEDDIG